MPVARLMLNRPAASAAPVVPPATNASQSPAATALAACTIDASGVWRTALTGSGALAIDTGASTTSMPSATSPIWSAGPNRTGVTPRWAAMAAPAATSAGPRSAPLASTAMRTEELVVVIVVVRVQLGRDDLGALVGPAHRAHAVRPPRAVALRAAVERRRAQLVLRAALVRARMRLLLLGDGHDREESSRSTLPAVEIRPMREDDVEDLVDVCSAALWGPLPEGDRPRQRRRIGHLL